MPHLSLLSVFVPTFFLVSLTPGMCMMLALSLGISVGVRRTLWMMVGELVGVGLVATLAAIGVAAVMLRNAALFDVLKWFGGGYLIFLGAAMWRSRGEAGLPRATLPVGRFAVGRLLRQGFVTAVANPKGWAFFIALLPPFLDMSRPLAPQLAVLIGVILALEFSCLLIYATGGRLAGQILTRPPGAQWLNRVAGGVMIAVGCWLGLF